MKILPDAISLLHFRMPVKREILNNSIIHVNCIVWTCRNILKLISRCSLTMQCYVSYLYSCRGRHQLLFYSQHKLSFLISAPQTDHYNLSERQSDNNICCTLHYYNIRIQYIIGWIIIYCYRYTSCTCMWIITCCMCVIPKVK